MQNYVFGYGSLMNPKSLQMTIPGGRVERFSVLKGYRRKFNFLAGEYLYLNIVPEKKSSIIGAIIPVSEKELEMLKEREQGYTCVDVTKNIEGATGGIVCVFIAPDINPLGKKILRSYIETCLRGVPEKNRAVWLQESILPGPVEDDLALPKYPRATF